MQLGEFVDCSRVSEPLNLMMKFYDKLGHRIIDQNQLHFELNAFSLTRGSITCAFAPKAFATATEPRGDFGYQKMIFKGRKCMSKDRFELTNKSFFVSAMRIKVSMLPVKIHTKYLIMP